MVNYQAHRPLAASFFLGHCLQPLLQPHSLKTIKQDADKSAKHLKQDADKPAKHKSIHEQIHRRPGWRNSPLSEWKKENINILSSLISCRDLHLSWMDMQIKPCLFGRSWK